MKKKRRNATSKRSSATPLSAKKESVLSQKPESEETSPASVYPENPFIPDLTEENSGPKIRSINMLVLSLALIFLTLFLFSSFRTSYAYESLRHANDKYIASELAANQLKHASNYLTAQTRMFAITQDIIYMDRYFEESLVLRNREKAAEVLKTYFLESYAYLYLDEACRYSYELMDREYHAMRLVTEACNYIPNEAASCLNDVELTADEKAMTPDEKIQAAITMTHDDAYQRYIDLIEKCVDSCIRRVTEERAVAEKTNAALLTRLTFGQRFLAILLMCITLITILTVMRLVLWPMNSFVTCIHRYQPLPMVGAYELRYLALAYNIMYNENQKTSAHLRHEAEHDPLTALYNRRTFDKMREEYKNLPIALILIDVDLFKRINDSYGHEVGDCVLKKVARLLDQNFRDTDFPCRVGGDEFAVIMTDASSAMKKLVKGKLLKVSEALQDTSDGLPAVTLSIGVAFNDREGGTEDIYKDADRALYVVKTHGRNGMEFYGEYYARL
ncbi:MAG: GGDEF domain-containing protein [Oscillibacter sp.]|nr:GGDEF domain-containing protein [Oscillibacter sp.]